MNILRRFPIMLRWLAAVMALWLALMQAYRLFFHARFHPTGKPLSGSALWLGFRFDLKFTSIIGLTLLALLAFRAIQPFRYYNRRKLWAVLLTLVTVALGLLYAADYFHYDYLRQRLVASVLSYAEDAAISGSMIWQSYPVVWLGLGIFLGIWLVYKIQSRLLYTFQCMRLPWPEAKGWYVVFVLVLGFGIFGKFGQYNLRWSDAFLLNDAYKSQLALNPMQSFFSTLKYRNTRPDPQEVRPYYSFMANHLGVKRLDSTTLNFARYPDPHGAKQPWNVVLVIAESFSMYKSSMSGNRFNTTPFFDSLCRQGVFFERCYTPSFPTARGVWATITSLPDVLGDNNRTASRNPEVVDQYTIINDFKGYSKSYFLGGDPTWANIKGLLLGNVEGLTLYAQDSFKASKHNVWGIDDKNLFLEADQRLKQAKTPFFSVIQTADNHRPYTIPEADLAAFKLDHPPIDSLQAWGFDDVAQYNAFRYTDYCFAAFFQAARKSPYFSRTIFVFVGDHGIPGDARRVYPKAFTEAALTRVHVPLLFYAPGFLPPAKISKAVSQLDILPSLAGLLGIRYRNNSLGRDLFDPKQLPGGEAFVIDHEAHTLGMVNDDYYYVRQQQTGAEQLLSVRHNNPVLKNAETDSIQRQLRFLTNAYYATARHLLYHNKKATAPER